MEPVTGRWAIWFQRNTYGELWHQNGKITFSLKPMTTSHGMNLDLDGNGTIPSVHAFWQAFGLVSHMGFANCCKDDSNGGSH